MCGIAGVVSGPEHKTDKSRMENALLTLEKRGPDASGIVEFNDGYFGHRRLSIIDTSSSANQPMTDPSGRYILVFNGEIFNFQQLRKQYLSEIELTTHSDTEVLLHLFIRFQHDCLSLLEGFFAFAIFDTQRRNLFLARDRFGKKPLHYFIKDNAFYFASEMKTLLALGLSKEIDVDQLSLYFQLNYIPQPYSIFKEASKLSPGHYMYIDSRLNQQCVAYYTPGVAVREGLPYKDACSALYRLLDSAVEKRLVSDVPLGAFLSGGVDSSVIVALASRHVNSLHTFSIGYKDHPHYDETAYAQLVAKKFKTQHTVFSLGNHDFLDHVHDVLDYLDEPFADSSAIPLYILSKLTKQHVTVALSGDGGDEVFSGYNKHHAEWRARKYGWLKTVAALSAPILRQLPQGRHSKVSNLFRQLNRFSEGVSLSPQERYWKWATFYPYDEVQALFSGQTRQKINADRVSNIKAQYSGNLSTNDFNEVLISDLKLVLAGDMLVKVDLMSMANSLEVRSPFLDHHVVDFAFTLPTAYKINRQLKKRIVQDTFRDLLPPEIYNRPKQGFEIPLNDWFKKELRSLIQDDLLQADFVESQGIFDPASIEKIKASLFTSHKRDISWRVWSLIVFQSWYKKYIL